MQRVFDEGITRVGNKPLPIECLPQSSGRSLAHMGWDRLHYHKYIELLFVTQGHYQVYINGETVDMPVGSMGVISSGELHSTRGTEEHNALMCIKFMPEILYSSEQTVTEMEYSIPYVFEHFSAQRVFPPEALESTFLPAAFSRIGEEHERQEFGYELAIRAEVMRIFSWILRAWHHQGGGRAAPADAAAALVMTKAREYVDQHYADATLTGAADYCGLSYSYLSRVFNRCMKMSFSSYVSLVRVNQSLRLLALTDMSVTEIALSCGFSSTSYYIQTFRRLKQVSPSQFRRSLPHRTPVQPGALQSPIESHPQ